MDAGVNEWGMQASGSNGGGDGGGLVPASVVLAVYTANNTVALNTIFDVSTLRPTDVVLFMGGAYDTGPLGPVIAPLTEHVVADHTYASAALAWAAYGDLNPATVYGWSSGNTTGMNVIILRNLDPNAPVFNIGSSFYYDDDPVPYGTVSVPSSGALMLFRWDYGHLDASITSTNLASPPVIVLANGGSYLSAWIITTYPEGSVSPISSPGYDHVASGDSWSACVGLQRG